MNIIHARIEMFYDLKEKITPELALGDTYCIMQQINKVSNSSSRWHLPGYDLDEIKANNVFDESGITEYAINQFKESYDEDLKSIIKTLFDVPGDVKLKNRIMYSSRDYDNRLGKTDVSIDLSFEKEKLNHSKCIDFVASLVSDHYSPIIMMDVRGYSLKQKQVFPDRVYAGWMLYLPIEIDPTLVPMAEEIISISDKNDKKGSLIITTKDIFDIENQEHINKANDIEICLRDLQILPLMTEL
ncbi:immunity 52 family protein [Photorhabdus tasmaniensis]